MPDSRIERARHAALSAAVDRVAPFTPEGATALLVTTTAVNTYPTTAGAFFASNPTEIDGSEIEGGAASYTADTTQVVYALNVGTQVPSNGTRVVVHAVGGRWVFRYDG